MENVINADHCVSSSMELDIRTSIVGEFIFAR